MGATTVFAELQSAIDRIWHVPEKAKPSGLWAVLRARVLSFGLIMEVAFLLMVSLSVIVQAALLRRKRRAESAAHRPRRCSPNNGCVV